MATKATVNNAEATCMKQNRKKTLLSILTLTLLNAQNGQKN